MKSKMKNKIPKKHQEEAKKLNKSDGNRPVLNTGLVSQFVFGDPDAKSDDVLIHCPLSIKGVKEFLSGSKNIVLGERGAGKSALFKLVVEGKFKIAIDSKEKDKPRKQLIVPIDDDLEYLAIANVVEERFVDSQKKPHGKYRYLWEIYILSRVVEHLESLGEVDTELHTIRQDFAELLGVEIKPKFRMRDLFTAYKITVSGKVDAEGAVTPSMSIEPSKKDGVLKRSVSDHEITELRDRIRKYLRVRNSVAVVLIDKIDDFVVGVNYEEQKKNMQALLECTQAFRLPEIKLKVFMRADLFNRLDFGRVGFDKLSTQVVRLEWTRDDICEFVARRLLYNYKNLSIKPPKGDIDLALLDLDPTLGGQVKDIFREKVDGLTSLLRLLLKISVIATKIKWSNFQKVSHSSRKTDLIQAICLKIITYIFPTRVTHYNVYCRREEMPIEEFLSTHFCLGGDSPNPRLVLLFLNFMFEASSHYYSRNPDRVEIEANDANEYELILREHLQAGYLKLQDTARKTIAQLDREWRPYVERLYEKLRNPGSCDHISVEQIKKYIEWQSSDEELSRFLAFFTHVGLFIQENPSASMPNRTYTLPTVLKRCGA